MASPSSSSLCSSARQSVFIQGQCLDAEFSFTANIYRTKLAKPVLGRRNALFLHGAVRTSSCFLPKALTRCHASGHSQSSAEHASEQMYERRHGSSEGAIYGSSEGAIQKAAIGNSLSNDVILTDTSGNDGNGCGNENGNGKFGGGGGDGDGGQSGDENDDRSVEEDDEFGSVLNSEEANKRLDARGMSLPSDMAESVKAVGIRSLILERFMDLQGARWPLGAVFRTSPMFRDRMLADQSFLFKLLAEIAIDSCCATFAEVQKRGKDFWNEFELYMADLIVGLVVCTALVGMLAPVVRFKTVVPSTGLMSKFAQTMESLPSSVFEAATQGRQFSLQQRVASYFYKSIQYGAVGFGCGIVGQGVANSIMHIKRKLKHSEEDVPIPPLLKSAALWGVFLAISANTRYQIVNGLERVVEGSVVAKRTPLVAMAFTVGIRFGNNVYGGMQFVDWARWSGVQ